jgi:hypothetical protein
LRAGALDDPAELYGPLGDLVDVFLHGFVDLVEELVEGDEVGALDIPVGLFRLRLQIDAVRQTSIQKFDHLETGRLRQVIFRLEHGALLGLPARSCLEESTANCVRTVFLTGSPPVFEANLTGLHAVERAAARTDVACEPERQAGDGGFRHGIHTAAGEWHAVRVRAASFDFGLRDAKTCHGTRSWLGPVSRPRAADTGERSESCRADCEP